MSMHAGGSDHATTHPFRDGRHAPATLASLLPAWIRDEDDSTMLDRLRDQRTTTRLELEHTTVDWSGVWIAAVSHPDLAELVGRNVAELASEAGQTAAEVVTDTLIADRLSTKVLTELH
ncbi:hypothetical protein [Plantibacter sp. YIM 135249]|uniref:hypothetical protein n=1 Tax=Plantibacter sp. YIM 135249 TaxID=3423918 RepID=UPI003D33F82A